MRAAPTPCFPEGALASVSRLAPRSDGVAAAGVTGERAPPTADRFLMSGCLPPPPSVFQAVCFLRPTRENVARIRRELRDPRFGEYHLCE
jgi:hypothetical protein